MPFISEKIKIEGGQFDRRIKLTAKQRNEIKRLYTLGYSMRKLGRLYNVNKTTIKNVVDIQRYKEQLQRYKDTKHSKKYYNRIKNTKAIRDTRRYKQGLYIKKLIVRLPIVLLYSLIYLIPIDNLII